MKVLISGASGLVGKALHEALNLSGHEVVCLVRNRAKVSNKAIYWDPKSNVLDSSQIEGFDAVVNLAGENIGAKRWSIVQKKMILQSRLESTKTLVNALLKLQQPPKVLINASAIGYYGNRGYEVCNEETKFGSGFLAEVCRQWEEAAKPAESKGIRTVFLRTGIVLSSKGGALSKMLIPFKLGLGGCLGAGNQYMSWIALDDLVNCILFSLTNNEVEGPINAVAPKSITNEEFTKILGKVLNRPTFLNIPAFALKGIFGEEMAKEMLLSSTYVEPQKLMRLGYSFLYPDLEQCLTKEVIMEEGTKSEKSYLVTLLLCILLGTFGIHRFYTGKIGTGILMLVTAGGFGIWWIIDCIMIIAMRFRDKQGLLIEP